ncbi:hypothetical protein EJB05_43936, partial [Eragrostis curvula]
MELLAPSLDGICAVIKNPKEHRCTVYLCMHHDPSRALGDLTGIKKYYCCKHDKKKWKCDKCNKRNISLAGWLMQATDGRVASHVHRRFYESGQNICPDS